MTYSISILLKANTPRCKYIFRTIFLDILGFDNVEFFTDYESFLHQVGFKISYDFYLEGIPFLASANNLLYENAISELKPEDFDLENELPCFYRHKDTRSLLAFDFAAMSFWLLTRYEEYQSYKPDMHGRFKATESYAFKNNFLSLPLIDFWAIELKNKLSNHNEKSAFPESKKYSYQPTFDIDYAWAYRNRAIWRIAAAYFRDLLRFDFSAVRERTKVLFGQKRDPYFSFSIIDKMHEKTNRPIYFWLLGDYGKFDKNTHYKNKEFRQLIKEISSENQIGIHPSYASNELEGQSLRELKRLEEISEMKINRSRQHFLKLNFPETYSRLLKIRISDDYSMGYAEAPGFRASIAKAYNWYNLSEEKETSLRIHPFMIMDVTLNTYLKLSTDEAFELSKKIIDNCMRAGANLVTIWHNNSFCETENWKTWTKFYERLIEYAEKK